MLVLRRSILLSADKKDRRRGPTWFQQVAVPARRDTMTGARRSLFLVPTTAAKMPRRPHSTSTSSESSVRPPLDKPRQPSPIMSLHQRTLQSLGSCSAGGQRYCSVATESESHKDHKLQARRAGSGSWHHASGKKSLYVHVHTMELHSKGLAFDSALYFHRMFGGIADIFRQVASTKKYLVRPCLM